MKRSDTPFTKHVLTIADIASMAGWSTATVARKMRRPELKFPAPAVCARDFKTQIVRQARDQGLAARPRLCAMIDLKCLAQRAGGEFNGHDAMIPGPGHSKEDRSLSVSIGAMAS